MLVSLQSDDCYITGKLDWGDIELAMVLMGHFFENESRRKMLESAEHLGNDGQELNVQNIKESKYEAADPQVVVNNHNNFNPKEKVNFMKCLSE